MNILDMRDTADRHLGRVLQLQAEQQGDADFLLASDKRYIEFFAALPYTPTNKVQKFKLRAQGLSANAWDRVESGFELER